MTELENSRIYTSTELNSLGYYSNLLTKMIREKTLIRLQRGFYLYEKTDELSCAIQMYPEAILCLETALFVYGWIDTLPNTISLAVHKRENRAKYSHSSLSVRAYFRDDKYIDLGVVEKEYRGLKCLIYDRERTLIDCLRKKKDLDPEVFRKAVKGYAEDEKKDLKKLREYARILRVEEKMGLLIDSMF